MNEAISDILEKGINEIKKWINNENRKNLKSIFSDIKLIQSDTSLENIYLPSTILSKKIVYPDKKSNISEQLNEIKQIDNINLPELNTNQILFYLEKYGSFIPAPGNENISLYDYIKIESAKKICLNNIEIQKNPFLLVSADFSGIQNFVYTISSKGALKTLRARSFFLEIFTEHCVYEILKSTESERFNIIYSGGGSFCLLIPNTKENSEKVKKFKQIINNWLFDEFKGKLYLAIEQIACDEDKIEKNLDVIWEELSEKLEIDKKRKFVENLNVIFPAENELVEPIQKTNEEACQVCHRDDINEDEMKTLPNENKVCPLDFNLFYIGEKLTDEINYIYRSESKNSDFFIELPINNKSYVYYSLKLKNETDFEMKWVINNWANEEYLDKKTLPISIANYVRKIKDLPKRCIDMEINIYKEENIVIDETDAQIKNKIKNNTASFESLARASCGADLIGCLRMDVDNMGQIFTDGLKNSNNLNLASISCLSRNLNLFFKVYLNEICKGNLEFDKPLDIVNKNYINSGGRNVSIVYSGGDDLFIIGAWDEVTEVAFDIQRSFTKFTCDNPDIGISGGLTLHKAKFPLYQMAKLSGEAEEEAKNNLFKCENYRNSPYCNIKNHIDCKHFVNDYKCNRFKNSISLFYTEDIKYEKERLKKITRKDNITIALNWEDADEIILKTVPLFAKFCSIEPDAENYPKYLNPEYLSKGFLIKLFSILKLWRTDGMIYLPSLAYIMNKIYKDVKKKKSDENLQYLLELNTVLYKHNELKMKSLHIPLFWIMYLLRGKEE